MKQWGNKDEKKGHRQTYKYEYEYEDSSVSRRNRQLKQIRESKTKKHNDY